MILALTRPFTWAILRAERSGRAARPALGRYLVPENSTSSAVEGGGLNRGGRFPGSSVQALLRALPLLHERGVEPLRLCGRGRLHALPVLPC